VGEFCDYIPPSMRIRKYYFQQWAKNEKARRKAGLFCFCAKRVCLDG
jgi:hypothetical protein